MLTGTAPRVEQLDEEPGLWEFLSQHQVKLVTAARDQQLTDRRARVQVNIYPLP